MVLPFLLLLLGLALLILGARFLVLGASQLALTLKVSPLIVGLTIVSFGTSSPEIGVCAMGAWRGEGSLVIGNIVGSNILNILLVLGICATITPLLVKRRLIRFDVPVMIVVSLIFWFFSWIGPFSRGLGILFLAGIIAYLFHAWHMLKEEEKTPKISLPRHPIWLQLVWIVLALGLLAYGSDLAINNAVKLATFFHINELFIGLTVLALGTSLPEIATSVTAVIKKENDLAVGNVVGSNLFNLLAVMGISGVVAPQPIEVPMQAVEFDLPVMVAVAIASLPIFLTGHKISRWEGVLYLFYYLLYLTYLILQEITLAFHYLFSVAFLFFILPLTLITLAIGIYRHFQKS